MRHPQWEARLNTLVASALAARFEWGKFDCCTFAADAVQAVTDADPMRELRGSYGSLRGAWRLLTELGGLRSAVSCVLGEPMEEKNFAQRGDIALVNVDRYPALGVVTGQCALVPMASGVQRVPVRDWIAAWAVR
jgi:hypothetical protein